MIEFWIGLAGGVMIGATGAGIGVMITPLLILAGYRPEIAVGTAVGLAAVAKITGALAHQRLGHWPGRLAWFVMAGGAAGAAIAWIMTAEWHSLSHLHTEVWMRRAVAAALLLAAGALWKAYGTDRPERPAGRGTNRAALLLAGLGVAPVEALTSVGSGSLLGPVLVSATSWNVAQLAAVSNLFGWMVGMLSVTMYLRLGEFDLHLFGKVLLGLVPGLVGGAMLSRFIERRWYALILSAVSVFLALKLLL